MTTKETITEYLSSELAKIFLAQPDRFWAALQEIRLRIGRPLIAVVNGRERYFDADGNPCAVVRSYVPTRQDIDKTVSLVSNFSMYAFAEELRGGYITIPGGHRVGLCGRVVTENGAIKTIRNLSALNFRLAHEIKGCADAVMKYIHGADGVQHTMIISPPCCGKTTLLRDMIRQISDAGQTVSVVDERSEIAGCYMGVPQNDVGARTDVLDGCPKAAGILLLLRAMSPKVVAVDEIGHAADATAIDEAYGAGIRLICTVHGRDIDEARRRAHVSDLIAKKIFTRYIVLRRPGGRAWVYDGEFNVLMRGDE
jgi:stage III sporulation protein AA